MFVRRLAIAFGAAVLASAPASAQDGLVSYRTMSPEVALDLTYFQPDGIHPNARAQPLLLDSVWLQLSPLLSH